MPSRKVDQVLWAATFVANVGAKATQYGVSAPLMTQFTALNTTLQEAWATAQNPLTRTKTTVTAAEDSLKAMKGMAKYLVSIVQGTPDVTNDMKVAAGLTVRKTTPSPKPGPNTAPYIKVLSVDGRSTTIELGQSKTKRGRPASAVLATVFTHTGSAAPLDPKDWTFAVNTMKTTVTIPFPASTTGDTVFITAFWLGSRGESSPAATPVSVNLPAGGVLPQSEAMKLAA